MGIKKLNDALAMLVPDAAACRETATLGAGWELLDPATDRPAISFKEIHMAPFPNAVEHVVLMNDMETAMRVSAANEVASPGDIFNVTLGARFAHFLYLIRAHNLRTGGASPPSAGSSSSSAPSSATPKRFTLVFVADHQSATRLPVPGTSAEDLALFDTHSRGAPVDDDEDDLARPAVDKARGALVAAHLKSGTHAKRAAQSAADDVRKGRDPAIPYPLNTIISSEGVREPVDPFDLSKGYMPTQPLLDMRRMYKSKNPTMIDSARGDFTAWMSFLAYMCERARRIVVPSNVRVIFDMLCGEFVYCGAAGRSLRFEPRPRVPYALTDVWAISAAPSEAELPRSGFAWERTGNDITWRHPSHVDTWRSVRTQDGEAFPHAWEGEADFQIARHLAELTECVLPANRGANMCVVFTSDTDIVLNVLNIHPDEHPMRMVWVNTHEPLVKQYGWRLDLLFEHLERVCRIPRKVFFAMCLMVGSDNFEKNNFLSGVGEITAWTALLRAMARADPASLSFVDALPDPAATRALLRLVYAELRVQPKGLISEAGLVAFARAYRYATRDLTYASVQRVFAQILDQERRLASAASAASSSISSAASSAVVGFAVTLAQLLGRNDDDADAAGVDVSADDDDGSAKEVDDDEEEIVLAFGDGGVV